MTHHLERGRTLGMGPSGTGTRIGLLAGLIAVVCWGLLADPLHAIEPEPEYETRESIGFAAFPPLPTPAQFPVQLVLDDDDQEGVFGVSAAGGGRQFLWFNRFAMPPGVETFQLQEIWVLFPSGAGMNIGDSVQLAVFEDPDGDPSNGATLVAAVDETIQATDDLTFSVYTLNPPVPVSGPGDVLIGAINRFTLPGTPPVSPASLDLTASQGRSWLAIWNADPPNPPTLPADAVTARIDDFFPAAAGNWMIRGFGVPVTPIVEIPTLSPLGLVALGLILALAAGWLLRKRSLVLLLALVLLPSTSAEAQLTIDSFSTGQLALTLQDPANSPGDGLSSSVASGTSVGGFRGMELTWLTGGAGPVSTEVTGGNLLATASADSKVEVVVTWDGDNDPDTLSTGPGFGGGAALNLITAGGGPASAVRLRINSVSDGTEAILRVYSSADNFSTSSLLLPALAAVTDVFFDYGTFVPDPGGSGADLTSVVAITLTLRDSDGSASIDLVDTVAPSLAATKIDVLTNDVDMDGQADPGDELTYTIALNNSGGEGLTVALADMVDANTTLVPGSVSSTPVAKRDQYTAVGNVTLTVDGSAGKPGLLANDVDPDGDTLTVASVTSPSAQGGTVNLTNAATGTFTYTSPAGFRGVDSFTYTAQDDDANMVTATATVSVDGIVWFVDNTHGGPFQGTQANPFDTFKAAETASAANDIIRIREGDGTDTGHNLGFILKPGQRLVGGAADLILGGTLIEAGTSHSVHSHAAGNVLDLAGDHRIEGMILNSTTGHGAAGTGSSEITLDNVIINPAGSAGGLRLSGYSGSFIFSNSSITATNSTSGIAVHITGSGGVLDFSSSSSIAHNGGGLIHISGAAAGASHNFSGTNPTLTNGSLDGIRLVGNNATSTFTFTAIGDISTTGTVPMLEGSEGVAGGVGGAAAAVLIQNSGTVTVASMANLSSVSEAALKISGTTVVRTGGGPVPVASLFSNQSDTQGLLLDGVAPGITTTGTTTISQAFGGAVSLNANGPVTFTGQASLAASAGAGILATNTGLVTVSDNTSSIAAPGAGLDITNTAMAIQLASVGAGAGVTLTNTTGTLASAGGAINGTAAAIGYNVSGGSPVASHGGTVTQNSAQRVVNIENTTGGSVSFTSGAVTGGANSLGVRINNADGNSSFADLNLGTSGAPMTNQALTLSGGSTGTHGFAGTQIFTTGARGVHADNGGTVEFTGTGNRVSATSARALTFENGTTIGGNGATFERIDSSGTDRGIRLSSAGSGFTVTGTGTTDGSGGVIQNITARGVEVISTNTVSLANMTLTDAATTNGVDPTNANGTCGGLTLGQNLGCNAPVHLQTVNGAILDNVDILRSAQVGINGHTVTGFALRNSTVTDAGNQTNEFSLKFRDMLGTSEITNSTIRRTVSSGTEVDQFRLQNFSSTQLNLTVTGSRFDTNAADGPTSTFENSGFIAVGHSVANMRVEVVNSFFENNKGAGLTVGVNDGTSNANVDLIVTGGTFRNNNVGLEAIAHGTNSTVGFDINGATVDDNPAVGINVDLNSSSASGVTFQGHVRNNTVTHTGAGDCIQVNTRGAGDAVVAITGNTLNESGFERAIDVSTQEGSGDLDVIITGNTVNMTGFNPVRAMNVNSGADTGDTGTMCAKVGGATAAERNTVNSISGGDTRVRVRRRENTVVNLQDVPGPHPQANQATIEAHITSQNTGATGNATVGAGFGDAVCTVPPIP